MGTTLWVSRIINIPSSNKSRLSKSFISTWTVTCFLSRGERNYIHGYAYNTAFPPSSRETQWYNSLFKTLSRFLNAYKILHQKPLRSLCCPFPRQCLWPLVTLHSNLAHLCCPKLNALFTMPHPYKCHCSWSSRHWLSFLSFSSTGTFLYSWQEPSPCLAPYSGLCATTLRAGNWLYLSLYFKNLAQWLPLQRRELVTVSWLKGRTDVNERKVKSVTAHVYLRFVKPQLWM